MGDQDDVPEPGSAPSASLPTPHACLLSACPFGCGQAPSLISLLLQRKQPPEQRQQQKGTLMPSPQLLGARMQPAKKQGLPANMIKKVLSQGHYHHYPLPLPI